MKMRHPTGKMHGSERKQGFGEKELLGEKPANAMRVVLQERVIRGSKKEQFDAFIDRLENPDGRWDYGVCVLHSKSVPQRAVGQLRKIAKGLGLEVDEDRYGSRSLNVWKRNVRHACEIDMLLSFATTIAQELAAI